MTVDEALRHFKDNYLKEVLEENLAEFNSRVQSDKQLFEDTIIGALKKITDINIQKHKDTDYKVMYFNYSLLRTGIINGEYNVLLSSYNQSWYLDEQAAHINVDMSFLFNVLDDLRNKLTEKSKIYVGKVHSFHIDEIVLEQAFKYYSTLEIAAAKIFQNIDDELWFSKLRKAEEYCIRWGEYKDSNVMVYKMSEKENSLDNFTEFIKTADFDNNSSKLMFTIWNSTTLQDIDETKRKLLFANFKNSVLSRVNLITSVLPGANFKGARLEETNFGGSFLENADFTASKLDMVSFEDAVLNGADFRYAEFKDVFFENSIMENVVFLKKDIPFIHLSPSQLQTVIIEEE